LKRERIESEREREREEKNEFVGGIHLPKKKKKVLESKQKGQFYLDVCLLSICIKLVKP